MKAFMNDDLIIDGVEFEECDGHSGVGWYYWSTDYPDEGSVGAFTSRRAAYDHACDSGWIS